jgi:hypothetical protein
MGKKKTTAAAKKMRAAASGSSSVAFRARDPAEAEYLFSQHVHRRAAHTVLVPDETDEQKRARAEATKERGNTAFKAKRYTDAVALYTTAVGTLTDLRGPVR